MLALGAGLFFLVLWPAVSAEITVPRMEMATRGRMDGGEFVLSSMISADFALIGGYKYAFLLGFSLEAADIAKAFAYRNFSVDFFPPGYTVSGEEYNALADKLNNQAVLGFRIAKATAKDIFGLPLELSYFLGSGDDFCSGDEFSSRFGLSPIGTDFRGFFYFPEGIKTMPTWRYDGIYGVRGTGFSLGLTKWDNIVPILYLYQDFGGFDLFGGKHLYSGDLRLLLHSGMLRLEGFGGISLNSSLDTSIRGGLMVHFAAGNGAEFFAQGGIPGWTTDEKFSIDNLFFLIEPRLHFGRFGIYVTFFYHPAEYIHIPTGEQGMADINVKFQYGNTDSGLFGGFEAGGNLNTHDTGDFVLRLSPFVSFISGGLRWDTKILFKPLSYDVPEEMFELFIGVRTAF